MLVSTIQRQLPIGSRVTVFRRDGQQICGLLSEIGRDHITIEDDRRQVTVLIDAITGWEVTNDNGSQTESTQSQPSSADLASGPHRDPDGQDVSKVIIEVEARFQAQLDTATIPLSPPDFAGRLPADLNESAGVAWGRITDRYREAARINELSAKFGRIQPITREIETICAQHPDSPTVHSHLAYLYMLSGDERALTHYQRAAIVSDNRLDWFNLAATSLAGDTELACYGLRRYFLLTAATDNLSAWYLYVRLIRKCSAYENLSEYLQVRPRRVTDSESRLLFETGIFLLKAAGDDQITAHLTSRWLAGDHPTDLALQAFQQVNTTPGEKYQRIATRLDTAIATHRRSTSTLPARPSIEAELTSDNRYKPTRGSQRSITPIQLRDSPRRWEQHYRDAALANTEGRIDDARAFFRTAVKAGGGPQVYEAFFKMEWGTGARTQARSVIRQAIERFPGTVSLFNLYGQSERQIRQYDNAKNVFRQGILRHPDNAQLRMGLAQTLVQIGTENSLQEAGHIFQSLDRAGKLHKRDNLYQRFKILQNPHVNRAFEFFQAAEMKTGIASQRDGITDLVVDVERVELNESFGLSGSFLVRCFGAHPRPVQLRQLVAYLRGRGPRDELVLQLQNGRRVLLNPMLAFVSVPRTNAVHDQVMRIMSDNGAAVIPLDDGCFRNRDDPVQSLHNILTSYLGRRDLYDSAHPVSGRRFFGRERLLVQLGDAVRSGQFVGIYGLRKIGKTSLVYQLRDEQLRRDAVAYVDLQASIVLSTRNCEALYWEIERALYRRLSMANRSVADLLSLGKEDRFSAQGGRSQARAIFAEDLRRLLDAIVADRAGGIRRVVILLDELEQILPVAGDQGVAGYLEFFGLLRGLAQTAHYRGILSCVVVAANAAISERGYWEGRENPVFALYKSVFIPPLPEDECDTMIRSLGKGMSVYWDREATSAVYSETRGHPFLTRSLCSYIAQHQSKRPLQVTKSMVDDNILPFLRDQGNMMEQITELMKTHYPNEARVLQQIALGETPERATDETLRHLLSYHLVAAKDGSYQVTLNLLHRWLRRRAGLRS